MTSSQPPSSAKTAEFPRPDSSSSTVTDRPRPKGPSAKRKRIIQEKIVTEPIQPIRPIPDVGSSNGGGGAGPESASGSGHNPHDAPPASAGTSARTRSRRSTAATTIGSSSYSSDVVPITPAAVDRKEKFAITQRTIEVAGKIAELGEVQRIQCFACAEAESKRQVALQDFLEKRAMNAEPVITEEQKDKLFSPIVCFYYDPAKLGIIKGVRMNNSNYGRCSNCMTLGCGCWWPTESLAPGVQAATAKALSTATAEFSLASIVNAGSSLSVANSSPRSSRRPDSQRTQEQAKPRRATAKRKPVLTDSGSMMVIESEPMVRPSVRFQESQAAAVPAEPAPAIAQSISPLRQPPVLAPRSPSPLMAPQAATQWETTPINVQPSIAQMEDGPRESAEQQPGQDLSPGEDQARNSPPAPLHTEEERNAALEAALEYMQNQAEADEEEYDGEFPLQHIVPEDAAPDATPALPVNGDSGVDLGMEVDQNGGPAHAPVVVEGQSSVVNETQGTAMEVDESQVQSEIPGSAMEVDRRQGPSEVVDQNQSSIQQEDVKPLPPSRGQSPTPPADASSDQNANTASIPTAVQPGSPLEEDHYKSDNAIQAIKASSSENVMERESPPASIHEPDVLASEGQPSATMNHASEMSASEDRSQVTSNHESGADDAQPPNLAANEMDASEDHTPVTANQESKANTTQSPIPATKVLAEVATAAEATTAVLGPAGNEPSLDSPPTEPMQHSTLAREDIQLVSHDEKHADNEDATMHIAATDKTIEDEYSFLFAAQEEAVTVIQEETVVLGVQSSEADEEAAMNDKMVVEPAEKEIAMDNGGAIEDAADETASSNGKALISDKEEEMAMNDGEADDNASDEADNEDADMDNGEPLADPIEDADMNDGEASPDSPQDKAVADGKPLGLPADDGSGRDEDALPGAAEDDNVDDDYDAQHAATTPDAQTNIVDEEEYMNALPSQHQEEQDRQQLAPASPSPSAVHDEQPDFVSETQRDPVPEASPALPVAAAEPLAEPSSPTPAKDSIQMTIKYELRQDDKVIGAAVEEVVLVDEDVEKEVVIIGEAADKEVVMVSEATEKEEVVAVEELGQAVEQEVALLSSQLAAAETRSPVTSTGRTRSTRSTRAAAKAIKKYSSSTNKNKGNVSNGGHGSTFGIPSAPPEFQLTPKWTKRLPLIPKADIIIQASSVPLKQDNRNLMSLDIPGVNKAFRKCTGCTLRECPCAPLPVDPEKRETDHTKYWQNSVLDSAGCLTCRVCGVICSFQLDPPIYGDYSTLPSPRTLDNMKLLPEDWDTRSALDGFDGEEEVNENGHDQSAGESRPPSHSDPTFLQSNKCSGCALRQCPCIALPAGEGRGGGCIKCKECNVACSFNVATPQPDGKHVVWADADSKVTGGRERAGNDSKRVTTLGKRKLLAIASDEEDGLEYVENGQ